MFIFVRGCRINEDQHIWRL